jgi:predicted ATP-grasp superfamily ATP-dependent carboligase
MPTPHNLVILGGSVRGVATSAARAGWSVHAADLFRDTDLVAVATRALQTTTARREPYPESLLSAAATFPRGPWCYTGGLENHPDLIDRLAAVRPLAGNGAAAVRAVRDHGRLAAALASAGIPYPPTFASPRGLPSDGSFLVKPRRSVGGRGIVPWHGGRPPRESVWQARLRGRSWSAAFVCSGGRARLDSFVRQLVGLRWCHGGPFAFCGAVEMPAANADLRRRLERLGGILAGEFGLLGLVGVDLVDTGRGELHVVEVNPRPTASMELAERSRGRSLAATHLAACGLPCPSAARAPAVAAGFWAKSVLFSPRPLVIDDATAAWLAAAAERGRHRDAGWPAVADLPEAGTTLAAGRPVVTIFARGRTPAAARRGLRRRTAAVLEAVCGRPFSAGRASAGETAGR